MKCIINTSFEPHFCALIDQKDQIVACHTVSDFKKAGLEIWQFLDKHKVSSIDFDWVGGVSGPGGFSSLRVSGVILNALSFRFTCPIRTCRADTVLQAWLDANEIKIPLLLNSFGQGVFTIKGADLKRVEITDLDPESRYFTSVLPTKKQALLPQGLRPEMTHIEQTLFTCLQNTDDQTTFVPDYEYPPVQ